LSFLIISIRFSPCKTTILKFMYFFKVNILKLKIIDFNHFHFISIYFLIFELRVSILHLSIHLIFHVLDLLSYILIFPTIWIYYFMYFLTLLQHFVIFQSFLILFAYLLNYFSILSKYLLSILSLFYFGFSILNCFWLLKHHNSLLI